MATSHRQALLADHNLQTTFGVLFDDDFRGGLSGWGSLIESGTHYPPSLHPGGADSPWAMILDTEGGTANVYATAAKRFYSHRGVLRVFVRFCWQADQDSFLRRLRFVVDWQAENPEALRRWYEIMYTHWDESGAEVVASWQASLGEASSSGAGYASISGLDGYVLGKNTAGKYDYRTLIWEIDTVNDKYRTITVDGITYDISGISLTGTQGGAGSFENGGNLLFYCVNRSNNSNADPHMLISRVRLEVK
jgi:hypothetical protein